MACPWPKCLEIKYGVHLRISDKNSDRVGTGLQYQDIYGKEDVEKATHIEITSVVRYYYVSNGNIGYAGSLMAIGARRQIDKASLNFSLVCFVHFCYNAVEKIINPSVEAMSK